jgi:hypothetical protein
MPVMQLDVAGKPSRYKNNTTHDKHTELNTLLLLPVDTKNICGSYAYTLQA